MKMRLINEKAVCSGLTLNAIYEGDLTAGLFIFADDDGYVRQSVAESFEPVAEVSSTPQPGQWWVQTDKLNAPNQKCFMTYICGVDSKNRPLMEDCGGNVEADHGLDWSGWHHEPECTGWDWVKKTSKLAAKATKTVTLHEVFYSDDLDGVGYVETFVGDKWQENLKSHWKYVTVISSRTVEVEL